MVRLPDPNNLEKWEEGFSSVPSIRREPLEEYFRQRNKEAGVKTLGEKAMLLGKSLALSGHVNSVSYHGIGARIGFCFVKAKVSRQVHHKEKPYEVCVILDKDDGVPQNGFCGCIGG